MRPLLGLLALAAAQACASPAKAPPFEGPRWPEAPVVQEEPPDPLTLAWIAGDWAQTNRSTHVRLVAYAREASAWAAQCKQAYAARLALVQRVKASVDAEVASIPAGASPYEVFDAFRLAQTHFVQSRDRVLHDESLDTWESSFFFQPIEARLFQALVDWERARDPLLAAAVWTRPLGNAMAVVMPDDNSHDDEARFCRRARAVGTPSVPAFSIAPDLQKVVRPPFEAKDPPAVPPKPPQMPRAYSVEGVVRSVSTTAAGTRVHFAHAWTMLEQRPPCRPAPCTGMDCNMGGPRTVCREITVPMRSNFDALFTTLPPGLTLRPGDAVAFQAAEEQTVLPPLQTHFHGIVLEYVDRTTGPTTDRLFTLSP
jgi:hypothetical protein